ncbi:MAG: VTT domain-containing protein, partial [Gammaproteobacteria bacterium]|nr:VTT domain-containing protein [Gammaproteobacteria bacterium]
PAMFADIFQTLLNWIQQHPHWSYLGVFLISAGESLALVGLVIPGVAIMFGIGALVAAGALELGPTLLWAAAGAVLGDGVSFWIGRHFHQHLRVMWPFSRYPTLLNRGVDFFYKHGGKSVVLARFLGPVRPILPTVAGMLDMPPRRFFVVNVISALLWAPAYTLPGVVFGASLGLAAEVAGRLAVLVLVLLVVVWFGIWLVQHSARFLQPRAGYLLARILDSSRNHPLLQPLRNHPLLQPLAAAVLNPTHPEARGLAIIVAVYAPLSLLSSWLLSGWLSGLDLFVYETMQDLRSPVADLALAYVTGFGDSLILLSVLGAGSAWLILRGRGGAALHWLAVCAVTAALSRLLKLVVAVPRPSPMYEGISAFSFPSSHTSLSVAMFGFLAVLIARELTPARRWLPYVGVTLLIVPIGFSRIYLGAHWLSDVLGGLALGIVCVALFGIAYRRHPAKPLGWPTLLILTVGTLAFTNNWHTGIPLDQQLERYAAPREFRTVLTAQWWEQDWSALPAQRHDLKDRDRQSLNVQYAGDLASLISALDRQGWRIPTALSAPSALQWLAPQPHLAALPVLPQVHDGQHETVRLIRQSPDGQKLYVLRLWPSRWMLWDPLAPLWIGSVTELQVHQRLRLFSYLVSRSDTPDALDTLYQDSGKVLWVERRLRIDTGQTLVLMRPRENGE